MNIIIIAPGFLPVPAIEGGAVETLIDCFIKYEQNSSNHIYVFSGSTHLQKNIVQSVNNITYFQFKIKKNKRNIIHRIRNHFNPNYEYRGYLNYIKNKIKPIDFDCIIIENRPLFVDAINKITDKTIFLHMHNDSIPGYRGYLPSIDKKSVVITVSKYIENCIKRDYPNSVTRVLYNGISLDRFHHVYDTSNRARIRKNYSIRENDIVIVFSGRISKEKGILELLYAYSNLPFSENLVLLIIGASWFNSDETNDFTKTIQDVSRKCKNRIIFTGFIKNALVAEVESVSDIAVLPSIWEEPFALSVLEAMASELAVVTTYSGGLPEMFNESCGVLLHKENHLIQNLTSVLNELISNPDKRMHLGKNARKQVELLFNEKTYHDNFINILSSYTPRI